MALAIRALRQSGRIDLYAVIAASAAVSYLLLIVRAWHYDSVIFFLGGNLILAAIPFAISQWLLFFPPRGNAALFAGVFLWLLFFPNAPYLVTDLIHLARTRPPVPLWFDLALFLSFAWNGLMLGYLSLLDLHSTMAKRFGRRAGWAFAGAALVLASFGIYIGRFLRWNSWDLFVRPRPLLSDVSERLFHPVDHSEMYDGGVLGVLAAGLPAAPNDDAGAGDARGRGRGGTAAGHVRRGDDRKVATTRRRHLPAPSFAADSAETLPLTECTMLEWRQAPGLLPDPCTRGGWAHPEPNEEDRTALISDPQEQLQGGASDEADVEITDMGTLLDESLDYKTPRRGEVIEGLVMGWDRDGALIDIGSKAEGVIPRHEMHSLGSDVEAKLQTGDKVLVFVTQAETSEGQVLLSIDKARGERGWRVLQERFEASEGFEAEVTGYNKGGLLANVEGVNAFVPLSQLVNVRPDRSQGASSGLADAVGTKLRLKVIEINRRRNRVILSERVALQEWRVQQKDRLIEELREGDIRRGRVSSVRNFGVFVDLGGADGLAHLSELSWDRDKTPAELYKVGDEVDVYVTKVDAENKKIALSLRRANPGQWEAVVSSFREGQVVTGLVTKVVPFGAFARIQGPVEGLIHVSELVDRRIGHPKEVVQEGDLLPLKVVRIERDRHRLGLSLRRARDEGESMGFVFTEGGEVLNVPDAIRNEFEAREGPIEKLFQPSAEASEAPRSAAPSVSLAEDAPAFALEKAAPAADQPATSGEDVEPPSAMAAALEAASAQVAAATAAMAEEPVDTDETTSAAMAEEPAEVADALDEPPQELGGNSISAAAVEAAVAEPSEQPDALMAGVGDDENRSP